MTVTSTPLRLKPKAQAKEITMPAWQVFELATWLDLIIRRRGELGATYGEEGVSCDWRMAAIPAYLTRLHANPDNDQPSIDFDYKGFYPRLKELGERYQTSDLLATASLGTIPAAKFGVYQQKLKNFDSLKVLDIIKANLSIWTQKANATVKFILMGDVPVEALKPLVIGDFPENLVTVIPGSWLSHRAVHSIVSPEELHDFETVEESLCRTWTEGKSPGRKASVHTTLSKGLGSILFSRLDFLVHAIRFDRIWENFNKLASVLKLEDENWDVKLKDFLFQQLGGSIELSELDREINISGKDAAKFFKKHDGLTEDGLETSPHGKSNLEGFVRDYEQIRIMLHDYAVRAARPVKDTWDLMFDLAARELRNVPESEIQTGRAIHGAKNIFEYLDLTQRMWILELFHKAGSPLIESDGLHYMPANKRISNQEILKIIRDASPESIEQSMGFNLRKEVEKLCSI